MGLLPGEEQLHVIYSQYRLTLRCLNANELVLNANELVKCK